MKSKFLILSVLVVMILGFLTFETTYCFMTFGETTEVEFETNGGNYINNIVYSYGLNNLTNRLPIPVKDGYTFGGWYLEKTFETKISNVPFPEFANDNVVTLYAKWNNNTYNNGIKINPYIIYSILLIVGLIVVLYIIKRRKNSK